MGEAKRRAALGEVLGETRADEYDAFLADLDALNPQTPAEHDRVAFMRIMGTAIVEALRLRDPAGDADAERFLEIAQNLAFVCGTYLASNIFSRVDDTAEGRAIWANVIMDVFAQGVMQQVNAGALIDAKISEGAET